MPSLQSTTQVRCGGEFLLREDDGPVLTIEASYF